MDERDVQQLARTFIANLDLSNIHIDLAPYIKAANATVQKGELGEGESGTTFMRTNGKHIITVNSLESDARQRFTVCHEIAHIILKLPSVHEETPSWAIAKRHINEINCDTFAAELLMPYKLWQQNLPSGDPSIEMIRHMADKFKSSFPATASRFASLSDIPCAFVTMERGTIRYATRSTPLRTINAWIPSKSPIPIGSIADRLSKQGANQTEAGDVEQDIWFQDWEKGLDLHEISRHYQNSDTTISLLWFDKDEVPSIEVGRYGDRQIDDGGLAELTGELSWSSRSKRR